MVNDMSSKKSVYFSNDTMEKVNSFSDKYHTNGDENFSLLIKGIVDEHHLIMERSLPEWSENEKLCLCALFNGHADSGNPEQEARGFIWNIYDGMKYDSNAVEILSQGDIDPENLKAKCQDLDTAARLATLKMCRDFWNKQ